jgi:hypothetical protein
VKFIAETDPRHEAGGDSLHEEMPPEDVDAHAYPPQPIPHEHYDEYQTAGERSETENTLPGQ